MRPVFGILRHVERRESNETITERTASHITKTRTHYQVMVTRLVLFWLVVWSHEIDWT